MLEREIALYSKFRELSKAAGGNQPLILNPTRGRILISQGDSTVLDMSNEEFENLSVNEILTKSGINNYERDNQTR